MLHIYSVPKSKINMIPSLQSSFYNEIWQLLAAEARSEYTGSTEKAYLSPTSESHRRRQWHPTPVLPGKSHGWRSLVGCSPWGSWGLHFHFSLSCIGEGNGNPLQCSCLENPRDREAWWAAVYGVAQSQTRLKRLSSSSSSSESHKIRGQVMLDLSLDNTETGRWHRDGNGMMVLERI